MSRASAFTLIEVLLALSLSMLLIGAVYWALAAGFDAHRRAERVVRPPQAVELALDTLRADLRGAVRPGGYLAAEFVSSDESTSRDVPTHTLTFYTTASTADATRTAGVRRVEWTLDRPVDDLLADRPALLRRVTDNLLAPAEAMVDEQVIAMGAAAFTFRFHDGEQWQANWDSLEQGDALPRAVEVTLAIWDGDERQAANGGRNVSLRGEDEAVYEVTRVLAVPAARLDDGDEQEGGGLRR